MKPLAAKLAEAERERAHLSEGLRWIAQQSCAETAEGASDDTPCTETEACATEWCLSCYAKVVLAEVAQGETGCMHEALVRTQERLDSVRDVLRMVLSERVSKVFDDDSTDGHLCPVSEAISDEAREKVEAALKGDRNAR